MTPNSRRTAMAAVSAALLFTLFMNGCALVSPKPAAQVLEERIVSLAKAKVEGDWARVYDHFSSNFKNKIKKEGFVKGSKIQFNAFTIEKIEMAPDQETAEARVTYESVVMGYELSGLPENQHWIKEDGIWVLDVKPTRGFID